MPYECKPENPDALQAVLPFIEIFSPNDAEAAKFLAVDMPEAHNIAVYCRQIEAIISTFLTSKGEISTLAVIIGCGAKGACIGRDGQSCIWIPANFEGRDEDKIVDVTGAGNAFLVSSDFLAL